MELCNIKMNYWKFQNVKMHLPEHILNYHREDLLLKIVRPRTITGIWIY